MYYGLNRITMLQDTVEAARAEAFATVLGHRGWLPGGTGIPAGPSA
jgi:hypothetical protein